MNKEQGRMFEPMLFDMFFKVLGVYPLDTIVRLSNGFVAVVIQQHDEDIFSPRVRIIEPEEKRNSSLDLNSEKDLTIDSSLNPSEEGKQYLPFIQS